MKIIKALVTFVKQALPDNTVEGKLKITLTKADGTFAVDVNGKPVDALFVDGDNGTFVDLPDGDYVATAQRLDSTGADLGVAVKSNILTVSQATFQAPATITISLG